MTNEPKPSQCPHWSDQPHSRRGMTMPAPIQGAMGSPKKPGTAQRKCQLQPDKTISKSSASPRVSICQIIKDELCVYGADVWLSLDSLKSHLYLHQLFTLCQQNPIIKLGLQYLQKYGPVTDLKPIVLIVLIDVSDCYFILINCCEYKLETKGNPKQFYLAIKISCHWICNSFSQIILWAEFSILCFNHNFLPLNIITERLNIIKCFFPSKSEKVIVQFIWGFVLALIKCIFKRQTTTLLDLPDSKAICISKI